jgi:hypothetical protein
MLPPTVRTTAALVESRLLPRIVDPELLFRSRVEVGWSGV